jgi:tetratricopeptide (TPR) repeat protein
LVAVVLGGGIALAADYSPIGGYGPPADGEKYVKEHPQDFDASLILAWDYVMAGRYDDTERELKRAETLPVKADDHSRVREYRAQALLRQGKIDAAIAELRAEADEAKSSGGVWGALNMLSEVIRLYRREGYIDVCLEMIDVGSFPRARWSTPMLMLAAYNSTSGLRRPLDVDWEAVTALAACGGKTSAMGPALADAVEAISPDSKAYPAAAKALCDYYRDAGNLDLAAKAGERAVKLDPDHWMGPWLLAQCYEKQQKPDDAIKQYQEMERTAGHQLDVAQFATLQICSIHERAGRLDLAFEEYQKTIYAYAGHWEPHHLAALAMRIGKAKEALAFFQTNREQLLLAMDSKPDPAWLGYNVAVMCAALGDRDGMVFNLAPLIQEMAAHKSWEGELLAEAAEAPDPAGRDILLAIFEQESSFPADQVQTCAEGAVAFAPDLPGANLLLAQILAPTDPTRAKVFAAKALEKAPAGSAIARVAQYLLDKLQGKPAPGAAQPPPGK